MRVCVYSVITLSDTALSFVCVSVCVVYVRLLCVVPHSLPDAAALGVLCGDGGESEVS